MMKRGIAVGCIAAATLVVLLCIAVWVFLAAWVPTQGKAKLIAELERLAPVKVSIGAIQYRPLQGILLEDVLVRERASSTPWFKAPTLSLRIGWWSLLLQQHVVFHAQAPLELPVTTPLTLSGRYRVRERHVRCRIRAPDIALESLGEALTAHVPPQLRSGRLTVDVNATWQPDNPLHLTGRLVGTKLVWDDDALRAQANLTLEGLATGELPSAVGTTATPWTLEAIATVREGGLEGLLVGPVSDIQGIGRLTHTGLEIQRLTGVMLGSPVRLEAMIAPLTKPSVEALVISRLELAALSTVMARDAVDNADWQFGGAADVKGVCRGPLQWSPGSEGPRGGILSNPAGGGEAEGPTPWLDCLAQVILRNASVTGPKLPRPLTNVNGRLDYDALTAQLDVDALKIPIAGDALIVRGRIQSLLSVPRMDLEINGPLPLDAIAPLLPESSPIRQLDGHARLKVRVRGNPTQPRVSGEAVIRAGTIRLETLDDPFTAIEGVLQFGEQTLECRDLTLQFQDRPLRLTAKLTEWDTTPRLVGSLNIPEGVLEASLRFPQGQDRVVIDKSQLTLPRSNLQLQGDWAHTPSQASHITLQGTVDLADLAALPMVTLPANASRIQGPMHISAKVAGPLQTWKALTLQASIKGESLRIYDLPVQQLTLEVEQADRTLRVRIPQARVADGTLWGEVLAEHRPKTTYAVVKFEVTALQLARLAQSIPAWHDRNIGGSASAQLLMSGDWDTRSTWRGEGWVNASGERLGNLPLLDKVFQGLFGTLGDRMGLDSVRRAYITQASVRWKLAQERFHTDDFRLGGLAGTEPVAVYAKGSVGLDQTLDFVIEPEFSEQTLLQAPSTASVANTMLKAAGQMERLRRLIGRHRLTGTLKKPEYRFELSPGEVFKQLGPGPIELLQGFLESLR